MTVVAITAMVMTSGCLGTRSDGDVTHDAAPESPPEGWRHQSLDGMPYHVWVPDGLVAASPLVLFLHGLDENAAIAAAYSGLIEVANETGLVVVLPDKAPSVPGTRGGIWREEDGPARRGEGDAGILARIVASLHTELPIIDPSRTYVAGFSGGGFMASVMGALYPDLFEGLGIGSAGPYRPGDSMLGNGAAPLLLEARSPSQAEQAGRDAYQAMGAYAKRMPVFVVHGTDDPFFGPDAGQRVATQWAVTNDLVDDGAENGSVPRDPTSTTTAEVPGGHAYQVHCYADASGHLIQYWLVEGMAHAWPGREAEFGDPDGPDATRAMVDFLDQGMPCQGQEIGAAAPAA